ncbi:UvrD-helicase domain-containing protein [Granulicella cerasi]|uniref:DNA 3'-5' helicase n=1 Tax=Granulicella cerasi TaxID=741063 RepID=A0ABW1Z3T8_9BACT
MTLDAPARLEALDTTRSFIVEAPAGSGKTGLMVQRFLGLLLDPLVQLPEEVLAITFTRKATAEFGERVLHQLRDARSGQPLAETAPYFERETRRLAEAALARDAQLQWRLLEGGRSLNIRSIDSVSAAIASAVPVLSGGKRTPVEDAESLFLQAARRVSFQLGGPDATLHDALHTIFLHRDARLDQVEKLIAQMLARREQWITLVPLDAEHLTDEHLDNELRPRLEAALSAIVVDGLRRVHALTPASVLEELTILARHCSELEAPPANRFAGWRERANAPTFAADDLPLWSSLTHLLLTASKSGDWRKRITAKDLKIELPTSSCKQLKLLIDEMQNDALAAALRGVQTLPSPRYSDDEWKIVKALFRVLRHALAELKVLFAERGESDFAELSLDARQALRAEPMIADIALAGGGELRHILVDEMQDTSAAQYDLLELLTRSWDTQRTLFVVGDPKQSIYAFRQADVARFLQTTRERQLGNITMDALQLTANFRSQSHMVEGFNEIFRHVFLDPNDPLLRQDSTEVPFVAADAVLPASVPEAIVWHTTILSNSKGPDSIRAAEYQRNEAAEVRAIVEQSLEREDVKKIAILARSRSILRKVSAELTTHGIASRAVEIDLLNERQEVLDALALTRALLHPADRIAWLAVLRAPWCGLSLADLLALTGEAREDREISIAALVESRSHLLSDEGQRLLERAWTALAGALVQRGKLPLATLVERTGLRSAVMWRLPWNHAATWIASSCCCDNWKQQRKARSISKRSRTHSTVSMPSQTRHRQRLSS